MIRVTTKDNVWRNTEDEVLKAAVMKYGKNQWSRVASLLHQRSADQCKARWFEWLDPSIKKLEWSQAEDEKLLHMAKIMPTQWRTIAPIIQRTAAQCLERYEYLLDQAQRQREGVIETSANPHLSRSDQIENKPARPDPIDMDDDEREMLSDVRARLLNTRGRKTDRQAREKQLEAARRLALLQKRRELHLAGVEVRHYFTKNSSVNYNGEIPFEKSPVTGFYDTTNESFNSELREHHSSADQEENASLKRKKEEEDFSPVITHGNGLEPIKKRSKLILPAPQITDVELEQAAQEQDSVNRTTATDTIMSDIYSALDLNQIHPSQFSSIQDQITSQTHNLDALSNVQTSLSKLNFIQPIAKTQ